MSSVYNIQVTNLRARGLQFLDVPDKYYTNLKERLKQSPVKIKEDIDVVRVLTMNRYNRSTDDVKEAFQVSH